MLDKVEYWLNSCDEDVKVAKSMLEKKHYLWAGFLCHLVAEKALKAVVANNTSEIPRKIHKLKKIAEDGGIFGDLSEKQLELLDELDPLQIEARYPEYKNQIASTLTAEKTLRLYNETRDFLCWIKQRLGK